MYVVHIHATSKTVIYIKKKIHSPNPSCLAEDISHCLRSMLELTHATPAVWSGLVSLGARATEGTRKVLAPSGRAGAALGALVDICRNEH